MGAGGLPSLSQKRLLRALKKLDVQEVVGPEGQTRGKGGHVAVRAPSGARSIVQSGTLEPLWVQTILRQLGLSPEDLRRVL